MDLLLANYRNDIAHGRTGGIDARYPANVQRMVNQLIRAKYFRPEQIDEPND
ncbi:hypothetical protein [Candidatus Poriferisodalis sp.]|uniref:hypothetical protein n=1 Tax=Candidatus Poriferisodalis sp. TaxID=3101277 RepID=UPI003B02D236